MLLGFLARKIDYLPATAIVGLNAFIVRVALPGMIIVALAKAPVARLLDWRFLLVFYGTSVVLYAAVFTFRLLRGKGRAEAAMQALGSMAGNTGYMGITLLLHTAGEEAAIISILAMTLDGIIAQPVTMMILESARSRGQIVHVLKRSMIGLARNPIMVSIAIGLLIGILGLKLPAPLMGLLSFMGQASSPAALFALGASLATAGPFVGFKENVGLAAIKTLVNPLMVWLAATWLLPLDPATARAAILTAALPTAATAYVIAEIYDARVVRTSSLVLLTHLIAVVTLSCLLVVLGHHP